MKDIKCLSKSFEDAGFLYCNLMGCKITDDEVIFYLDAQEKVDAYAVDGMSYWGDNNDLTFKSIGLARDYEYVVSDEYLDENCFDEPAFVLCVTYTR